MAPYLFGAFSLEPKAKQQKHHNRPNQYNKKNRVIKIIKLAVPGPGSRQIISVSFYCCVGGYPKPRVKGEDRPSIGITDTDSGSGTAEGNEAHRSNLQCQHRRPVTRLTQLKLQRTMPGSRMPRRFVKPQLNSQGSASKPCAQATDSNSYSNIIRK